MEPKNTVFKEMYNEPKMKDEEFMIVLWRLLKRVLEKIDKVKVQFGPYIPISLIRSIK